MKKEKGYISQVILTIIAAAWLFPIIWIILTAFREEGGRFVSYIIPKRFTLQNFINLFTNPNYPFVKWFLNTLFVSVVSCIFSTIITVAMAYTLSRIQFKMRKNILKLALILNMFPGFMSMIAVYYILKSMNLTQSLWALILVYSSGAALNFYIVKGFFDTIPYSLDEAAMIDGATKYNVFTQITLPLSKPIIVYTMLMAFTSPWMDFIFAKVIMGDQVDKYTVAIGLYSMMTRSSANSNYMSFAAGCVLIAIPISLLFMKLQKYYVEGITGGSVKG
ncbi:MAG TPA: sugar ABC transporter permease [Candidatus Merdenecus merdavium]|nr:sugar ABC transporter permease [Candidatus Merdenecus merdavium]